jgi:hypothetical protein
MKEKIYKRDIKSTKYQQQQKQTDNLHFPDWIKIDWTPR